MQPSFALLRVAHRLCRVRSPHFPFARSPRLSTYLPDPACRLPALSACVATAPAAATPPSRKTPDRTPKSARKPRKRKSSRKAKHQLSDVPDDEPHSSPGLSPYRQRVLRKKLRHQPAHSDDLRNMALDKLLTSSLHAYPSMQYIRPLLKHAIALAPKAYEPSPDTLNRLMDSIVRESAEAHIAPRSTAPDVATEAFFRLTDAFVDRPNITLLQSLARYAAADPVAERRSQRVWSVVRAMRSMQLPPTPEFFYTCFQSCVAGLDVASAVTLMEHAINNNMCDETDGPRQVDYYNGVMRTALLAGQYRVVTAAHSELLRRGVAPDDVTEALFLSFCIDTDDARANILLSAFRRAGRPLEDIVLAGLIRAAGRRKDTAGVQTAYNEFERGLPASGRSFEETLSEPAKTRLPAYGALSEATCATARADPTMSAFHAFRACAAPEEALALLVRLREQYGFRASKTLYSTIIETCWRAGKLELAQKLRVDMESASAIDYSAD